ncbi:hypothetical protein VP01_10250g1, partial [Puccinia sorghi]
TPTRRTRSKKTRKHNQMLAHLTPSECALEFLKILINHQKKRHPKTILKENEGHQTIRTSTPRAESHQRKLQILSNHMRRMTQVAIDGLSFEMLKFERQVKNDDKGVELEEKKFNHSVALEEK